MKGTLRISHAAETDQDRGDALSEDLSRRRPGLESVVLSRMYSGAKTHYKRAARFFFLRPKVRAYILLPSFATSLLRKEGTCRLPGDGSLFDERMTVHIRRGVKERRRTRSGCVEA